MVTTMVGLGCVICVVYRLRDGRFTKYHFFSFRSKLAITVSSHTTTVNRLLLHHLYSMLQALALIQKS